ncbi:MAG: flagellar basal-body MS-ring/collar protein FliF [Gammaproteobacteria bacterium]|jgi:flagellar M-ring protein FliF
METQSSQGLMAAVDRVPGMRQFLLLIGLAASIAAGLSVVLWAREPGYKVVYGHLEERDASEVVQALQSNGIPHRLDAGTGAIMVPGELVRDARLKLAAEGLPRGAGLGLEMIEGDGGFTVSQFMEGARYQHALEVELARTIMRMRAVESARVHLALPRQTAFVRQRQQPSASVLVHLFPGRRLEESQIAAVVNLVASSIPDLTPSKVTVVDQLGQLLSSPDDNTELALTARQFEQQRRMEQELGRRIESMLTPLLGPGSVRATVAAELDFTVSEETRESFDPNTVVMRSERTSEDLKMREDPLEGVPGAISNDPTTLPEEEETLPAPQPISEARTATRNFEVDRTVSHVRAAVGGVKRLSVAVLVDHRSSLNEDGEVSRQALNEQELDELRTLVKEAVGFDEERGDSVSVINASFQAMPEAEPLAEGSFMEQGWIRDLLRQLAAVGALLALVFGVVRPVLRGLTTAPARPVQALAGGVPGTGGTAEVVVPAKPALTYEERVAAARNMAAQNPDRVAQIVRDWVSSDG